jgi:hypothetical protein
LCSKGRVDLSQEESFYNLITRPFRLTPESNQQVLLRRQDPSACHPADKGGPNLLTSFLESFPGINRSNPFKLRFGDEIFFLVLQTLEEVLELVALL